MEMTRNMTQGKPLHHIVAFSLPIMLSYILQQFFEVVDGAVVGRLIGVQAFASVGAAGFLTWMVQCIIMGFTQGFGALFAQRFGASDETGLRKAVAMSIWLSLIIGVVLTVLSMCLTPAILTGIHTPDEILENARIYLFWRQVGILIAIGYNLAGSILRALGNSKAPLYAVLAASVINVALDILLVAVFHLGVAGVAIATVLSQVFALCICLIVLRRVKVMRLDRKDFAPDLVMSFALIRIGGPLAFRDAVISVGDIVMQSVINGFGVFFIAGINASRRYFGMIELIAAGLEGAVATFVGQNYGAKKLSRIQEGMKDARKISLMGSLVMACIAALFGKQLIGLLVAGTPEEIAAVVEIGYKGLLAFAVCLPALYMLTLHRSALQGIGNAFFPMMSGFTEMILRIFVILILPPLLGEWGIYFAYGIGWIGAAALLMISYRIQYRKVCGGMEAEEIRG